MELAMAEYVTRAMVRKAQSVSGLHGHGHGLGQEEYQPVDILAVVRDLHRGYSNVEPLTDFVGAHPWTTFALFFIAILAGGAAGGYIGAGLRTKK
jgi:hypothetical protein